MNKKTRFYRKIGVLSVVSILFLLMIVCVKVFAGTTLILGGSTGGGGNTYYNTYNITGLNTLQSLNDSLIIQNGTITNISVNSSTVQYRVSSFCASGSSIRVINWDGTVTCETDSTGGGVTLDEVAANVGNFSAEKSNYALLTYVNNINNVSYNYVNAINNLSLATVQGLVNANGNYSQDEADIYLNITDLQDNKLSIFGGIMQGDIDMDLYGLYNFSFMQAYASTDMYFVLPTIGRRFLFNGGNIVLDIGNITAGYFKGSGFYLTDVAPANDTYLNITNINASLQQQRGRIDTLNITSQQINTSLQQQAGRINTLNITDSQLNTTIQNLNANKTGTGTATCAAGLVMANFTGGVNGYTTQCVSTSGYTNPVSYNMTTAQYATTTTTYLFMPNLTNVLSANSVYTVECNFITFSAAVTTGEQLMVNTTGTPTAVTWTFNSQVSATTRTSFQGVNTASNAFADTGSAGTNVRDTTELRGYIKTAANPVTVTYEMRSEVGTSNAAYDIGSICYYTKVI